MKDLVAEEDNMSELGKLYLGTLGIDKGTFWFKIYG